MKMKKGILAVIASAFLAFSLCMLSACGETAVNDEQLVKDRIAAEMDAAKNLDPVFLEAATSAASGSDLEAISEMGVEFQDILKAMFKDFDYEITNVQVDGDTATGTVNVTIKDVQAFETAITEKAEDPALLEKLQGLSMEESMKELGNLMMQTIEELPTTQKEIELPLEKKDGSWEFTAEAEKAFEGMIM